MRSNYLQGRTSRRLLSVLLIMAMVITSLGFTAISGKAYAATSTHKTRTEFLDLANISSDTNTEGATYATDTDTYTCEAEGWTWNATDRILTLDGVTIDCSEAEADEYGWNIGIEVPKDSTIKVTSDSTVIAGNATDDGYSCGIYSKGNLTIDGADSTLTTKSAQGDNSFGIYVYDEGLTISDGTSVEATAGEATGEESCGIYAEGITNYGTVDSNGGYSETRFSVGMYSYSGDLVNYGSMECDSKNSSYATIGICVSEGNISNNGSMYGDAGKATGSYSNGILVYDGDITNNGKLSGYADDACEESIGISVRGNLTNNGNITAFGGTATESSLGLSVEKRSDDDNMGIITNTDNGYIEAFSAESKTQYSIAIYAEDSIVNSGEMLGSSDKAAEDSVGIQVNRDITNDGTLIGYGGEAEAYVDGIFADEGTITNNKGARMVGLSEASTDEKAYAIAGTTVVNNGNMEAYGADSGSSYGIYGKDVTLSGAECTVKAKATKAAIYGRLSLTIGQNDGLKMTGAALKKYATATGIYNETGSHADEYVYIARPHRFIAKARASKNSVKLTWNDVNNADAYKVYVAKCGTSKYKLAKNLKNEDAVTATVMKLKAGTKYKMYVVAYDQYGDEITTSPVVYVSTTGGKYSNATKVTAKSSLTIHKDRKTNVDAKIAGKSSSKTLLYKNQCAKLRYFSADTSIATVSKTGKVTALKTGVVSIYSVAPSGAYAVTTVTVE